ncbi:2-oxoglutarate dehydrogenase, E2 component, dihydrolipoamide succinyltransferase [Propioniferax innocua]|uniref:Dihydrolipoamide acetyltransferase component of pyruvate dehydrogenase complex n=1 Tax=Propioniferax innocua TaxID=1753 RepID=A0A542ZR86_9ACTN|nr:2-oxoglutarate dehydrogenase, E2 component, dihydrolipoamide succinyltransferase [Propioniferax innocua]TQL62868.1 2-oxoglutarate dehydrogenase E2 component [Propioniferax innocua]
MSTSVTLPALGESVTEGTVSQWLKSVGDRVEVDEALVEISTDKVDTEVPSPVAGTLLEIRANEDDTIEVGEVLAIIGDEGEAPAEEAPAAEAPQAEPEQPKDEPAQEKPAEDQPSSGGGTASGTEVTLPALGESVTEGTVSQWLKSVGDSVEVDEALVEISTDKVDTEVPSPVAGTLLEIRANEDDTIEVGEVLAIVGDGSAAPAKQEAPKQEAPKEEAPKEEPKQEAPAQEEQDEQGVDEPGSKAQAAAGDEGGQAPIPTPEPVAKNVVAPRASNSDEGQYVTPLVRKLAEQKGVDLSSIKGTGVGGRIRKQDVLDAAAAPAASQAPAAKETPTGASAPKPSPEAAAKRGTTEKLSRLRKTIAKRMTESLQVSAQLTATVEVDLTLISRIRKVAKEDFKKRNGVSLSYLPFITKAAVEALQQFPKVNATIDTDAGTATYSDAEHIGIAVDTERGLLVPVIKNAGDLNVGGLARQIGDVAARTRKGDLSPDDLTGGTFTITNYGSGGTLFDTPIINQPQVAILGTGALVKRPMVMTDTNLGETIAVRDMMYLSLTYDHRLVDGADAARFLSAVKERLEEGDFGAEFGL